MIGERRSSPRLRLLPFADAFTLPVSAEYADPGSKHFDCSDVPSSVFDFTSY
jgi:hypothetical protein